VGLTKSLYGEVHTFEQPDNSVETNGKRLFIDAYWHFIKVDQANMSKELRLVRMDATLGSQKFRRRFVRDLMSDRGLSAEAGKGQKLPSSNSPPDVGPDVAQAVALT
jgi:hypothetical protein